MKNLDEDQVNNLVDDFFTTSLEDIVGLFAIAQAVEDLTGDEKNSLEPSMRIVEKLLEKGMLAGYSPYDPDGYRPWPNQDRKVVMDRIRSEWIALGHSPSIPDIVWFGPSEG